MNDVEGLAEPADAPLDEPPEGHVTIRGALVGVGLLWLAAVAAIGSFQAAVYGATVEPAYVLVAVAAAAVAVGAARRSLVAFGFR